MRRRVVAWLICCAAAATLMVGCTAQAHRVAVPPRATDAVSVCGTVFCLDGKTFYPYGASFYSSSGRSGILSNPSGGIALAKAQHLNTVRAVNWLDHNGSIASATANSTWTALDQFIADARAAGLKAVLDLSDFKTILLKHCVDPYTDYADWDRYIRYAASRVNSATGATYGNDQEIAWVQFLGEPREAGYQLNGAWHDGVFYTRSGAGSESGDAADPRAESDWGTDGTACPSPLHYTGEDVTSFFAHVEATWKRVSRVLTLAGGLTKLDEAHNGGIDYRAIFADANNDLCGFKTYGGMAQWLQTGVSYCTATLRKPSVNVEWGYQQGVGDATRAVEFQAQFANNASAGIAANFFWNSGDQLGSSSYDVGDETTAPLTVRTIVKNAR